MLLDVRRTFSDRNHSDRISVPTVPMSRPSESLFVTFSAALPLLVSSVHATRIIFPLLSLRKSPYTYSVAA